MKISLRFYQLFPYLVLLSFIAFLLIRILIIFIKGTDIAGIEQNVIYSIQQLMHSQQLYGAPADAPFSITQYTPLYYYLCSFTAKTAGYGPMDIQALYCIGRAWNVLFNIFSALIVFKMSRSIFMLSKNESYLLLLLSFALTFSHNFAVRPDSLGDMTGLAALYCFMRYQSKLQTKFLLITVLLSALSFFSKQSGIQFILLFGGYSLLNKQWKALFQLIIFTGFIYGALAVLFRYIYPSFFSNVIGGVINGINLDNFIRFIIIKPVFILSVWPLILLSLFFLIRNRNLFKGSSAERLLALCVLGTLIFASVTALKMGSTIQYYVIFINVSLIFILKSFHRPAIVRETRSAFIVFLFFSLFLYAAHDIKLLMKYSCNPALDKQRTAAIKVTAYIRQNSIKNSGRFIFANLSTDTTIPSRQGINNIFFQHCLVPQMDILEYSTAPSKVIGYQRLEEMLKDGEVEYIIESTPVPKFRVIENLAAIKADHYKCVQIIEGYSIYRYSLN